MAEPRSNEASAPESPAGASVADELVDGLLPEELDWQRLVRRYPKTCLAVALVGGFCLGRSRGVEIVEALSGYAADTVADNANQILGRRVL